MFSTPVAQGKMAPQEKWACASTSTSRERGVSNYRDALERAENEIFSNILLERDAAEETPFTSMVRKGPAPKSTYVETLERAGKLDDVKKGWDVASSPSKRVGDDCISENICGIDAIWCQPPR